MQTDFTWNKLEVETWREYVNADGQVYRIDNPKGFWVNPKSGTHYVLDSGGVVHTLMKTSFMVLRFNDVSPEKVSFIGGKKIA